MKRFWEKRWLPFLALIPFLLYAAAAVWTSTRNVSQLPVLMYHHVSEDVASDMVISPARFEAHMTALKEHGWNSVTIRQLIEFGEQGTPLPDHPVLITFDDGYTSNLELAAPILERSGLNAVIFVIGINAGQSVYAHSGQPLDPPRFALEDARPYLESGVLEVESHTFDLHQRADYGYSGREGVLPLADEPEEAYRQVLASDCRQARRLLAQELGQQVTALAYPFGLVSKEADRIFGEEGIKVTVTSVFGPNQIRGGDPASLRMLNRYAITDNTSTQELLDLVNWHKETFGEKVLRHLGLEP